MFAVMRSSSYIALLLIAVIHLYITATYYSDISLYSPQYFDTSNRMDKKDVSLVGLKNLQDLNSFDMYLVLNISYNDKQMVLTDSTLSAYLSKLLSYSDEQGCGTIPYGLQNMFIDQTALSNYVPSYFSQYLHCQRSESSPFFVADLDCDFSALSTIYESTSCSEQNLQNTNDEPAFLYVTWQVSQKNGFKVLSYSTISRLISSYESIPCSHTLGSGTFQIASWRLICLVSEDTNEDSIESRNLDSQVNANRRRKLRIKRDLFKSVSIQDMTVAPSAQNLGGSSPVLLNEDDNANDKDITLPIIKLYTPTGQLFDIKLPQTWQSLLVIVDALAITFTPPHCDWLRLVESQSRIIGIPLFDDNSICNKTQFTATSHVDRKMLPQDSHIMEMVVVKTRNELETPSYVINTTSLVDLSVFKTYQLNVTSQWTPSILSALFIVQLSSYIPYLSENDFSVVNATISYTSEGTNDSVNKVRLYITWYSHKIGYDIFNEQFYKFLMDADEISSRFFFAMMPDFVVQSNMVESREQPTPMIEENKEEPGAFSGLNETESDILDTPEEQEASLTVIIACIIIAVMFALVLVWFVVRLRRKRYSYSHSSISTDNTYARRRKPAYTPDEMIMSKFQRPSRPNIFSNEVLGAIINNQYHHSQLPEDPVVGQRYVRPLEDEQPGPSHSRPASVAAGSYYFQTYNLVDSNSDISSTGDDTIASSFDYHTSYYPQRLIPSKKAE